MTDNAEKIHTTAEQADMELYRKAVMMCVAAASVLAAWDIPALLDAISHPDAVGPMLDPTLWRDHHKAMEEDREILTAALPLYRIGKRMRDAHGE